MDEKPEKKLQPVSGLPERKSNQEKEFWREQKAVIKPDPTSKPLVIAAHKDGKTLQEEKRPKNGVTNKESSLFIAMLLRIFYYGLYFPTVALL